MTTNRQDPYATRYAVDAVLTRRRADLLLERLAVWLCDRVDAGRLSVDSPVRDDLDKACPLGADADEILLRAIDPTATFGVDLSRSVRKVLGALASGRVPIEDKTRLREALGIRNP